MNFVFYIFIISDVCFSLVASLIQFDKRIFEYGRLQKIPFGRYRNQPITRLLDDDDYVEWMSCQVEPSPQMINVLDSFAHFCGLLHVGIAGKDYRNRLPYAANVVNTSGDKIGTSWRNYYMDEVRSFCEKRQTINHPSELPQEFDNFRNPQTFEGFDCANAYCDNHAKVGGHVYVKGCGADMNCIVPLCYSCNNNRTLDWSAAKKYTFPLRAGTFVVYIDAHDATYNQYTNRVWTRKGRRAMTFKERAMREEGSDDSSDEESYQGYEW